MPSVCGFSFITHESEIFRDIYREFTAGPVYFYSITLRRLGSTILVVTRIGEDYIHVVNELKSLGIDVIVKKSKVTTSFHTVYGKSIDERFIEVKAVAEPFNVSDLNLCPSVKYIYIGPLTTKDFDINFIKEASKRAPIILDAQGFTREVRGSRIKYTDWSWKVEGLKYITVLKVDRVEAKLLTGYSDIEEALDTLISMGPNEVLLTSSEGVYLRVKGRGIFHAPFIVDEIRGRVGRGDTCTAAYTHAKLRGWPYDFAIKFAAATTSIKLSYQGPFRGDEKSVLRYIKERYETK